MRKNKKLLLGGLSVLTLVAAGSGAVSTFAWFASTVAATPEAGSLTDTLTVSKETATGVTVKINVTLRTVTVPELSDADGKTYYIVNGTKYEHEGNVSRGQYEITVDWASGDKAKWNDSAAAASYVDIDLKAKAQVTNSIYAKLLVIGATNGADGAENANIAAKHEFRVKISAGAANGTGGVLTFDTESNYTNCTPTNTPSSKVNGYFALRPGYENTTTDAFVSDGTSGDQTKQMSFSSLLEIE